MSNYAWMNEFVDAAKAPAPEHSPALSEMGNTRSDLLAALANAHTLPQTPVVRTYIAEVTRRLQAL
ncbi:hypothetical protein [Marinobacter sp.]|uniref:hypothetical protein n=1 Tax=Marinobacter sp. TaxID=50741 RepID=UPI003A911DC0